MRKIVQAAAVLALMLAPSLSQRVAAITVVPMTFEQLVDEAAAVVYARVADVRGQWTLDRRSIDSVVALEALRYFKGSLGPTLLVRLPGGEAGGVINVVPGAPVLRQGELVVLFLKANGPAIATPLGLTQGVFRVVRDGRSGTMLVSPPPLKASAAGRIMRGSADRRMLAIDVFESTVRGLGAAR
jgi:hypothetical protein